MLAGLAALVDKSLLRRQDDATAGRAEPRLVMLETIREYGLERLEASGEAETLRAAPRRATTWRWRRRRSRSCAGRTGRAWGARLEREHDNLRAALRLGARPRRWRNARCGWPARCGASGRRAAT